MEHRRLSGPEVGYVAPRVALLPEAESIVVLLMLPSNHKAYEEAHTTNDPVRRWVLSFDMALHADNQPYAPNAKSVGTPIYRGLMRQ